MTSAPHHAWNEQPQRLVAPVPGRVLIALDHFTPGERAAVEHAALAFARGEITATRLPDPEPLYLVRATPTLLVLIQHADGHPVVIEDIITQEAWDRLARAG